MKSLFRFLIGFVLAQRARRILRQSGAKVIGVTGSIGKTSTRKALSVLLKPSFKVCRSRKSFNTPIGLSLSILGEEESGFSSPIAWLGILWRSFTKKPEPCDLYILEMGADHPGDIQKLIRIAMPHIGVVTHVSPVHLGRGQFKNIEHIAKEKSQLVRHLTPQDVAILNADDPLVREMPSRARRITYGLDESAAVRATQIRSTPQGIRFFVSFQGKSQEFQVPVLGAFHVHVLLPAIVAGLQLGLSLSQCAQNVRHFSLPPGRMNPIEGLNDSQLIDGSYNASPVTMHHALDLLKELPASRKIAALGTMNELGELSRQAHLDIGNQAAQIAQMLVAVGPEAPALKQGAIEGGMKEEQVFTFFDSEEAGHFLQEKLRPGDLILVKGSQNRVRMEKLVKCVMKHPEKAAKLLCRQGAEWEKID